MKKKISVTIPVHNEEKNLKKLLERILNVMDDLGCDFEIIFINDGSRDDSKKHLDRFARKNKNVRVIHFTRNFGQTAAMMAGFDHASGDVIVPMDADLQNDPEDIPLLLAELEKGYDVCSGWRRKRHDSVKRRISSSLANKLISKISGVKLKDYGCTLKAYRKKRDQRSQALRRNAPLYSHLRELGRRQNIGNTRGGTIQGFTVNQAMASKGLSKSFSISSSSYFSTTGFTNPSICSAVSAFSIFASQ